MPVVFVPQSARDLIAETYGAIVELRPQESVVTVGTSAVAVGKFARQRVAVLFCNNGSVIIYLGFNPAIATGQGIQLAVGQSVSFMWPWDGELVMQDYWAITTSGSQSLYVLESVLSGNG